MLRLRLSEFESRVVELSSEALAYLHATFPHQLEVTSTGEPNHYLLTARHHVGSIRGPDIEIRIEPKVGTVGLFYMIGYAHSLLQLGRERIDHDQAEDVYDLLLLVLTGQLEELVLRRLRRGYVERSEDLPVVRGRLLIDQVLRRPAATSMRIPCRHEEFTADLLHNQVIRHTLEMLPFPRDLALARRLRRLRSAFRFATRKRFAPSDIDSLDYDRLTDHYEPIHRLCRLLLEASGVGEREGGHPFATFLIDMNKLFERFVAEWLRAHLPSEYLLDTQVHDYLDRGHNIPVIPDLVLRRRGEIVLVADTKYKRVREGAPGASDAYQLLAYCRTLGVRTGVLIYPNRLTASLYRARDGENALIADGVELGSSPSAIDTHMKALAARIATLGLQATQLGTR